MNYFHTLLFKKIKNQKDEAFFDMYFGFAGA